jgi:hypothetical protein
MDAVTWILGLLIGFELGYLVGYIVGGRTNPNVNDD